MTGGKIPIFALTSTVVVATLFCHGPEQLGGNGDLSVKLKSIEHLAEKERLQEAEKVRPHFFLWLLSTNLYSYV